MNIQSAYSDWSATYDTDRNLTRDLDQAVTQNILGDFHFRSIVELGCGTGKNTGWLASIGERVLALDLSTGMLARAKEKHASPKIQFAVANLIDLWPCKDHSVDLVACNLVLEHVQDLSQIFAQSSHVLIDGGQIFICELHPFRQYQGTLANFQRADKKIEIQAFTHHVSEYINAARQNGFALERLNEWWHVDDENKPPRLLSLLCRKL
jgi:ubiquinone/menaquinone biosynthesis C-methylase UbiE